MELELIERLKSKQAEQRKAYQQLEAVLSLGTVRCVVNSRTFTGGKGRCLFVAQCTCLSCT